MNYSTYEETKDSGIEWIGKIPSHWDIKKVYHLFELGRGRVIDKGEIMDNQGQYPVYSSQTNKDGVLGKIDSYEFNGEYLTWTTDGANAGTVFRRTGKFNCTNVCGTLKPRKEKLNLSYLKHSLSLMTDFYVRNEINPKLMNNVVATIRIIFPPYEEQNVIANFLDQKTEKIDELIEKKEELIDLLEEKKQAVISKAVTKGLDDNVPMKDSGVEWIGKIPEHWSLERLKYYIDLNPTKENSLCDKDLVTFLPMEMIHEDGSIDKENAKKIKNIDSRFTHFKEGDVLLAKITPCFENGKSAIASDLYNGYGFGTTELHVLRAKKNKMINKFLYYIIRSNQFLKLGESRMTGAAGQKRISSGFVNNYVTGIPPLSEQRKIASFLDAQMENIDKLQNNIKEQISNLKEYRKTLITKAVTGKIDVRELASS